MLARYTLRSASAAQLPIHSLLPRSSSAVSSSSSTILSSRRSFTSAFVAASRVHSKCSNNNINSIFPASSSASSSSSSLICSSSQSLHSHHSHHRTLHTSPSHHSIAPLEITTFIVRGTFELLGSSAVDLLVGLFPNGYYNVQERSYKDGEVEVTVHPAWITLDSLGERTKEHPTSTLLITCEHASADIPEPWRWMEKDRHLRDQHWASDPGAKEFTHELARKVKSISVLSTYSRLLCDPNRPIDSETMFRKEADGHAISLNQPDVLTPTDKKERLNKLYHPYHLTLRRMNREHRPKLILSVHSFTPVYEGVKREVEIGVLYNNERDLPLANRFLRAFSDAGIKTGLNVPWSAKDGFAYAADQFSSKKTGVIMFEFRQDLIVNAEWRKKVVEITRNVLRADGHQST